MALKNKQIIMRYISSPIPSIMSYVVEYQKKDAVILKEHLEVLEPYQHEKGLITDHQVLGDKIIHLLEQNEKELKDGVIVLYDMPDLLRFNTVVPKLSLGKAKLLAKKELNDFFKTQADSYHSVNRMVSTPDKGIIFYFDIIHQKIIKSLDELALAMDKYVDSHTNFAQALASTIEDSTKDELNTFVVYQDDFATHILLLLASKLIDVYSVYKKLDSREIMSAIEVLRNKHLFSFERKESNQVIVIANEQKEAIEKDLVEMYHFELLQSNIRTHHVIAYSALNIDKFKDGFHIKV